MGLFDSFKKRKKANIVEKEQEETKIITEELFGLISKYNAVNSGKIDVDNVFIGECVDKPGCIGCIYRSDGWYLYGVDERFNLLQNGPFSLNGIIVALSICLYIPLELQNRRFDNEELNLFLNGKRRI